MQLKIKHSYISFEWIPYYQFNNIKEIGNDEYAIIYLAIWKNDPLSFYGIRKPDKKVILKCLHNSQNISSEFLNEV